MRALSWKSVVYVVVLIVPSVGWAGYENLFQQPPPEDSREYPEGWKGYYFYQDPPGEEEPNIPPQQLPHTSAIPLQPEQFPDSLALKQALKKIPVEKVDLANLPAVWLKLLLTAKKEEALDAQTESNLLSYIKVHKETFNRAQRFTDMWALVMYTHPENDFNSSNPISTVGHEIHAENKRRDEDEYLRSMNHKVGLFFFFSSTCPYCQKQSKLLKVFSDTHGIRVKAVTQDGRALPEFPDAVKDNGMGDQLGVTKVPVIFLAIPDEEFLVPVGTGLITMDDLRVRVLQILKYRTALRSHKLQS